MAEIVNFMEQRLDEGYACAVTGLTDNLKELPQEKGDLFWLYFERFGQEFCGRPKKTVFSRLPGRGALPRARSFCSRASSLSALRLASRADWVLKILHDGL